MDIKIDTELLSEMIAEIQSLSPSEIESRLDQYAGESVGEMLGAVYMDDVFPNESLVIPSGFSQDSNELSLDCFFSEEGSFFGEYDHTDRDASNDSNFALAA